MKSRRRVEGYLRPKSSSLDKMLWNRRKEWVQGKIKDDTLVPI